MYSIADISYSLIYMKSVLQLFCIALWLEKIVVVIFHVHKHSISGNAILTKNSPLMQQLDNKAFIHERFEVSRHDFINH